MWINNFPKPLIISGPCSAESESQMMQIASEINADKVPIFRAGIWKPRTKPGSFEGVGTIGLSWLEKVKQEFGLLTATEVANAEHVKQAFDSSVDILWIGARSTVNPFTVQEIADSLKDTPKIILVKNPVNPDLDLWIGAVERLQQQNIKNIGVIHRGFSTYKKNKYRNNPQWQIPLDFKIKYPEIPIICDPSHIGGRRDLIFDISQQALNYEFHGLMIETHNQPDEAWSDASQQITPQRLSEILNILELRKHDTLHNEYKNKLNFLRAKIDELDREVWENFYDRMKIAEEIGMLKKQYNIATYQPERWQFIYENAQNSLAKLGLSEEFVKRVMHAIHQESLEVQNKIINED